MVWAVWATAGAGTNGTTEHGGVDRASMGPQTVFDREQSHAISMCLRCQADFGGRCKWQHERERANDDDILVQLAAVRRPGEVGERWKPPHHWAALHFGKFERRVFQGREILPAHNG